jgi:putative PIN family toxin of toxin-antitoxin system
MTILIDTNGLLSAALRDRLPERVVLFVATDDRFRWIVAADIRDEYRQVLSRPKFGLSDEILQHWAELIDMRTIAIANPPAQFQFPRDPKDIPFLACAIAANADYLITGDRDLLDATLPFSTRIVTVAQFATEFGVD